MIYSRSIVLNSVDNTLKKALLKIQSQAGNVSGSVKLYNFREEPMGVLSLGLMIEGKVQKAELKRVGYMEYSFGSILTKIPGSCTCALVSSRDGNSEPVLVGAINQKLQSSEERLLSALGVFDAKNLGEVEQILDDNQIELEDQQEIEEEIDKCFENCNNCENCVYKKVFYDEKNELPKPEIAEMEDSFKQLKQEITRGELRVPNQSYDFIDEIGGQIDLLFEKYPSDEILNDIIPNSKWVKVDFNNDKKFYVVGLIYEGDEVKYICYGVPAKWSKNPPADFNESAQWLPIDLAKPEGDGYWLTYQDANSGDLIQVNII